MRNYTYQITPKRITELAQEIHNEIDINGEMSCEAIVDLIVEELNDVLRAWVEDNIDWSEIASNDMEARNDYYELREARRLAMV